MHFLIKFLQLKVKVSGIVETTQIVSLHMRVVDPMSNRLVVGEGCQSITILKYEQIPTSPYNPHNFKIATKIGS